MKTVVMKPYLSYLPSDYDNKIIDSFMDCFFKHQKENIKGFSEVITDYSFRLHKTKHSCHQVNPCVETQSIGGMCCCSHQRIR